MKKTTLLPVLAAFLCLEARAGRSTLALDGIWQVTEGRMDAAPALFERTVPVPGLVSLATPAFDAPGPKVADRNGVAQKDPKRDAFWYRRTFTIDGPIPAVARLKVAKAMFGTRVFLNGTCLGDHGPSFTPGFFDAKPALKSGLNEILLRIGADRDAVGRAYPDGFDFEKERYIPGVFDSVELVLSGTPHFLTVQAAPDIAGQSLRVQAVLRNDGSAARAAVKFVVREAKSGKVAGRSASPPVDLAQGAETTVDVRIALRNCRLWSPEDPFLYTLEADSGSDSFRTRFGMREFHLDPATGRAMLNGRPYFMRGSNITLYRFFEDGECGPLPWDRAWVRLLHQRVKDMHWNCLRYCIGFPPEAWYDIADEQGVLIEDEFPIWYGGPGWSKWPPDLRRDELAREYAEWVRERWNHPCVVIWDADNETSSGETAPAIQSVRGLDLSHRPWDNSYSAPQEPGDMFESHPYHFQDPHFTLANLATAEQVPQGNAIRNDAQHAVIINEYGWLWLNRDGTPTTLTQQLYQNLVGANATASQRFHIQATSLAAETEFWRAHRNAAAVMHFTTLGYARPDGQTSDHWTQGGVAKLQWEPEFHQYVRDAFAPVGLMIDYWNSRPRAGTSARVPVVLINDLDRPWHGPVTLRVQRGNQVPVETKQDAHVAALGTTNIVFNIAWPEQSGPCVLEAELRGADGEAVHSVRDTEILDAHSPGPASGQPAAAPPVASGDSKPENVVDFRYAPPEWQTLICLPDDPCKSLVDKSGALLYDYDQGGREFGTTVAVEVASNALWQKQALESPRVPVVRTCLAADSLQIVEEAFALADLPPPAVNKNGLWVFPLDAPPDDPAFRHDLVLVRVTNTGRESRTFQPRLVVDAAQGCRLEDQRVLLHNHATVTCSLKMAALVNSNQVQLESMTAPAGRTVTFFVFYSGGGGIVSGPSTIGQAEAARDHAVKYWEKTPLPFGRVQVPDAGIQALVDSSIRNIWQAREIRNGMTAFEVGPTCYRGLWIVDGAFLLETAAMLGAGDQARHGVAYELTHQKPDGRIEVMGNYWKENGIVLWTCARHAQLTQDKAWLLSQWPKLERIAQFIRTLRQQTLTNNSPLDDGLIPPGFPDGGLAGVQYEYTNPYWNLLGLRSFVEAARWLGKTDEAAAWQHDYDDFMAAFRKAAARDLRQDANGNAYLPILMGEAGAKELPQRAQWAFCHAVYPGQIFAQDDPLVAGNMAMLQATEREGMVYGTGWDAAGIWNYFASFYGHAWLWQGDGRKAARILYAFANHAAPVLDWREEQSLRGETFRKVGDMPHNWASAEFIRLTVHLLEMDRGLELHLFEGLPPEWTQHGMVTRLNGIATPFGKLTMQLKIAADGKTARLHVEPLSDAACRKIIVHLAPWAGGNKDALIELDAKRRNDRTIPLAPHSSRANGQ